MLKQCEEKADGSDCIFRDSTDTRDCWVGGATPTAAPGETPPPPTTPPPPEFPKTIKVIGIVFEDDNNNGILDTTEQILGPRGGVTGYQYLTAIGNPRTVDCDSQANAKGLVKEAIDTQLSIQHRSGSGSTILGDSTMCYGGYIQMNSSGNAFIESAVDCYKWGGSCERSADCNCAEYNGIKCVDNGNCSQPGKTNKDEMYKARSNSFYAKLRDFGLNSNYMGPASWTATRDQLMPVWGMYTVNVDNNEKLKIRVPDTYQITRTYLISTRGTDDPLVAPHEPAVIRNLGITDTIGSWDAWVANTGAVVVWGIRTKRATIRAKAHSITNNDTCNTLQARPTVAPVDFTLAPVNLTKTQTGADYVEWNNLAVPGAFEPYNIVATPSASVKANYLANESLVCQYKNGSWAPGNLQSAAVNATKGDQFDVEFGYKPKTLTIQVRAKAVPDGSSCTQIRSSANGINTTHSFTLSATDPTPAPILQTGNSYVTFDKLAPGNYRIHMAPSSPIYVPFRWCMQKNGGGTTVSDVFDIDITNANAGDTIAIDAGFGSDRSWVQTGGGDVTAETITSYMPGANNFSTDNAIGFPGIVSYATSYDFRAAAGSKGEGNVSSTGWLVQESYPTVDYYQLLSVRFGSNKTPHTSGDKPGANGTYIATGPYATTSAWTVASGQSYVVFVNGTLDVNYDITVASGGFLAFIVNGDITIGPDVGVRCDATACTDTTPTVEGVYITSPSGVFKTGVGSTSTNNERLLLRGSFIAGSFQLDRDLGDVLNRTTPAETFSYEPEALVFMPEDMKKLPVTWQEVAP